MTRINHYNHGMVYNTITTIIYNLTTKRSPRRKRTRYTTYTIDGITIKTVKRNNKK